MWSKLNPKLLWGRPIPYDNYFRFDILLDKGIDDGVHDKVRGTSEASSKRLHYGNGLFYIFKTTAKNIKFKYKFHHSNKDDYATTRQAVVEPQLCGKLKNTNKWIMLNKSRLIDKAYPNLAEKDLLAEYIFEEDFEEFQFCLPFGVVFYYMYIDTNEKVSFIEPTELKIGFLGSSVANMSACYASCSIPAQIYRELNINSTNLAIPISNSIVYKKLLDFVKKNTNTKWYLLDTINICKQNLIDAEQAGIEFACIKCRWPKYIFDINYIFELDNPCYNRDNMHLTTAGAYAFIKKLLPILEKDL